MAPAPLTLRELVIVEKPKPTAEADACGHKDQKDPANWVEHCKRRAEVVATGVVEVPAGDGQQMTARTTYLVKMRYDVVSRTIDSTMRILWDDKVLNLVGSAFDPDGTRRELRMNCIEAA